MLGCSISGGLGNQFFRYAFARKILYNRKAGGVQDRFIINDFAIDHHGSSGSLFDFNIVPHEEVSTKRLVMAYGTRIQQVLYMAYAAYSRTNILSQKWGGYLLRKSMGKNGIIVSVHPDSETLFLPHDDISRVFVHGNFENPAYFSGIEEILKDEFVPKAGIIDYNKPLFDVIKQSNSVFLGVRRGDFMQEENKKTFYVCDLDYYRRAITYMQRHLDNPVFIVFSNDIPWVKANLRIDGKVYFESGHDPVWETFRLMSSCRHFIISNSTLHWWAQFCCKNPQKIVVAPERWYNAPGWENHLMLPSFVRLKTGVAKPFPR